LSAETSTIWKWRSVACTNGGSSGESFAVPSVTRMAVMMFVVTPSGSLPTETRNTSPVSVRNRSGVALPG
jgi:hypothetical protein